MAESNNPSARSKLTVVTNLYHPDELGGAALMTDFAEYMMSRGYDVNVVSTFAYYPRWRNLPEDSGRWRRQDLHNGIPITRVKMYVPQSASTIRRLVSDWSFFFSIVTLGRSSFRGTQCVVTACPMFGQTLAMRFIFPFRRVPKLCIVQDFVVDAAVELGMIGKGPLAFCLKKLERWALRSCSTLTTISQEMLEKLRGIVGEDRRTLYIPNWIHGSLADRIVVARQRVVDRAKNRLFYSGNVGRKQGLPDFIKLFHGTETSWTLQINGGGAEFDILKESCAGRDDIDLKGLQDEELYIHSLLTCSACLVTQKSGVGANFLPSKVLPALASGTPILAVCESTSPLGREIIEAKCGEVVSPNDEAGIQAILTRWSTSPEILEEFSRNALIRSVRHKREVVLESFRNEIEALIATTKQ